MPGILLGKVELFVMAEDMLADSVGQSPSPEHDRRDAVARLFAQHDRWLFAYLVSLLGNSAHAEEVFQEVCVVLWREYETFRLGTDFVKWVSVIAHNQVHRFRRQQRRVGPQLSDAAVELISRDAVERFDLLESRREALRRCLEKLPESDRCLVSQCYSDSRMTIKTAATAFGQADQHGLQGTQSHSQDALPVHRADACRWRDCDNVYRIAGRARLPAQRTVQRHDGGR